MGSFGIGREGIGRQTERSTVELWPITREMMRRGGRPESQTSRPRYSPSYDATYRNAVLKLGRAFASLRIERGELSVNFTPTLIPSNEIATPQRSAQLPHCFQFLPILPLFEENPCRCACRARVAAKS